MEDSIVADLAHVKSLCHRMLLIVDAFDLGVSNNSFLWGWSLLLHMLVLIGQHCLVLGLSHSNSKAPLCCNSAKRSRWAVVPSY